MKPALPIRFNAPATLSRCFFLSTALFCSCFTGPTTLDAAEAFELGEANFEQRPGGKEADSIVGDFVLRNDRIEAVVSGNLPLRRANMSTFYGDDGETPGCLYDLTLRGENNDQITVFSPLNQRGPVNYVKVISDGSDGEAIIEVHRSAAKAGGLARTHQYRLRDGWQGVLIVTTLHAGGEASESVTMADMWSQMRSRGQIEGIHWADAIDPAHKCGYAHAWVAEGEAEIPEGREVVLEPGESLTVVRFLAIGRSPAEAVSLVAERRGDAVATFAATLRDPEGQPVTTGRVLVHYGDDQILTAYPDDEGVARALLPPRRVRISVEDIGRETVTEEVEVAAGETLEKTYPLSAASSVVFTVTDGEGNSIPCKAQFNALGDTPKVNLGPTDRAHGCVDQYHSERGDFRVPLPPGKYEIIVTRGPEHNHHREEISLPPGGTHEVHANLKRVVDSSDWISADFHNHATPSGDNTCGVADRVINLAAEHIEFAPTTEHNRLYDWAPYIERLGLSNWLKTVPGMELTGRGAHLNTFPLRPEPHLQDGGAPVWNRDPRINAINLRDWQGAEPDRWVHLNHPDMTSMFIDRHGDGRRDGGYAFFGGMLDGIETQNYRGSQILANAPFEIVPARTGVGRQVRPVREFIWLQMLNQGLAARAIAVSDAHHVHGNGVGGWRTYVPSSTDDPAAIDWREISRNAKAGRMILTTGPYLEVETGSGILSGGLDRSSGRVDLHVRVQCADWLDVDRVQVLVNGRQLPQYNYTRESHPDMFSDAVVKFDQCLELDLSEDSHLIVVAVGEGHTLKTGFGSSAQSSHQPIAYNNPIYVDVTGGGFRPNGDTIGFELPVAGITVDEARGLLGEE